MTGQNAAWTWQTGEDPRDLVRADLPLPAPARGEVLVRNAVIGLNPVDWKVLGSASWKPGKIPGCDGAGTVIAVGEDVPQAWLGQRVAYHTWLGGAGSFAQVTPVAERALLPVPARLDLEIAAALPCPALTAWLALEKLPARAGRLLVSGAGGAVGGYLVQLAQAAGWQVTAQCHPRHHPRLEEIGATCVPWETDLAKASFHAAIDLVEAEHAQTLFEALRANGHLVCIQGRVAGWGTDPFGKSVSLHEVALGALHQHGDAEDWQDLRRAATALFGSVLDGRLLPEERVCRSFDELPAHLQALKTRDFSGKALIRV